MKEDVLGKENVTTLFFKYSIPAIAGMLFLGLNTIVDGFFVGHYIGVNALASVNIAMPFFSIMVAVGVVIGIGTQSFIGVKLGEGDITGANDTFKTSLCLITAVSLVFSIIAVAFTEKISVFLGASDQLLFMVTTYISVEGMFLPLLGIMFVLDYVLKVMGKPIYSMQVLVAAVTSHMIFNYLLIAQLGMGIKGAALATGLGYSTAFVMAVYPFITARTTLKLLKGSFNKTIACKIIYNGSSEGLAEIGTGVTTFLFNITLMRYVGEAGVAAFTAVSYLAFIGNNILIGLADGVGAITSYNYGSGKIHRVKRVLQLACIAAFAAGVSLFTAISVFSREIITIFLDAHNEAVLTFAEYGAELYALAFLINGVNIVVAGYFTAICKPQKSVLIALSRGIVWIWVGIVILPKLFGITGIWLTVPVAELFTSLLSGALLYNHYKYQIQRFSSQLEYKK